MTNLTEKWKKGELPAGRYWVKYHSGRIDEWDLLGGKTIETKPEIVEVLATVPPYEVYKDLIDGRKLLREYIKDITNENTKLETENKWYSEQLNVAVKEVGQLKELLTMVKPVLQLEYNVTENRNLIKKINQVLGEE